MIKRTSVLLPRDWLNRARRKAAAEGRTLASLIEEGLRAVVDENRRTASARRILPCISQAAGGPILGVDITDTSALQEADDLEYVERMKHFR